MYNYFLKFGRILDFSILYDKKTGKSKGYGFIVFEDKRSVEAVIKNKHSHSIRGKWIDCKPAYDKNQEEDSNYMENELINRPEFNQEMFMDYRNQNLNDNFSHNNNVNFKNNNFQSNFNNNNSPICNMENNRINNSFITNTNNFP